MTEVISVKFKNRGKSYFFAPNGITVETGDRVIVETTNGLEIADCCYGNHQVADTAVVQPLRPVVRTATADDIRIDALNRQKEKDAFGICEQKIEEHKLDMKLVDVECNFEGTKTTFFFTSDGRVDFRDLVKDLAGIFRNRIELRQIGVRDEAKMIGGIGICGRPYCCSQFLDDFQPVSTKMAKVQSLSLNPAKISGSCGRLMCCLRYEQEAYEELIKSVPKQGAFVETKDGYGTVVQVDLLRQKAKVKLDDDGDDSVRTFKAREMAAVPGGRPKDGEPLPSVLRYVPEEEEQEEEKTSEWEIPAYEVSTPAETEAAAEPAETPEEHAESKGKPHKHHRGSKGKNKPAAEVKAEAGAKPENAAGTAKQGSSHNHKHKKKGQSGKQPQGEAEKKSSGQTKPAENAKAENQAKAQPGKATVKPVKTGGKHSKGEAQAHTEKKPQSKPAQPKQPQGKQGEGQPAGDAAPKKKKNNYYHHNNKKKKPSSAAPKAPGQGS